MPSETLVMIPPMLCDARIFGYQIRMLSMEHAVMFAPTTRGERMEEVASQILSWAPSKFALAGMGMGGMVAMEIMRRASERVTRIALIATTAQSDTPEVAAGREPHIIAARSGRFDDVLQHEVNSTWLGPNCDKVRIIELLKDMGRALGPDVYVKQARAMQRRKDQQATLRAIKQQPSMVICGRFDGQFPLKRQEVMAEMLPYGTLEVIEQAGYLPTLDAAEPVTDALRRWMQMPLMLRP
ncbi:alpha/beta fold hydrolase [Yoonia sediminilitoris]|uniref:Pimeloyl-ACP methyl ester carboxylesterase n=1 Tax=Yoonia sediminilitoris TaxID=1286148 RepID=A0A2T6KJV4_9RHOB|nr:alpha/beta hydrolase [Yoonia sediminilitoris]PUB16226.1 pimeloyl-ACP methyl ester carboxylesterase [Yoonia sediminilitoris]RCW96575.1 pimeloyl-ACP methyl ester carboxylesterase [Yoonia sediminilitoris]